MPLPPPATHLVYRDDEPSIELVQGGRPWSFDGDGHLLRLMSEAQRIHLAWLFDPYLAISSREPSFTANCATGCCTIDEDRPMTGTTLNSPGYRAFLDSLKKRVRAARVRAALSVNLELVLLYWDIGRDILARQAEEGWGASVIARLSNDLRREFPCSVQWCGPT